MIRYNFDTFNRHIFQQTQGPHCNSKSDLNWLLSAIVLACKIISREIRHFGISDCRDVHGKVNVHGERQQGLDVFANNVLTECLGTRGNVGLIASEEDEKPVVLVENPSDGEYMVIFDPLDGSSNIDVNVSVGTIFAIYRRDSATHESVDSEILLPGIQQLVAGYVLYGSSTVLVYTTGQGVHGFTLDPTLGTFVLSHPDIRMPRRGHIYSVNESYADAFPPYCRRFLHWLKSADDDALYRSRYVGSLVADFHRAMLKGGVFMYPPTSFFPNGKLRLLYEANPIAMLAEQAGGIATDGYQPILSIMPQSLHQRVPLYVGSQLEMEKLKAFAANPLKA